MSRLQIAAAAILICGISVSAEEIAIVGYNDTSAIFAALNAIYAREHPGVRFRVQLKGTATAAPALTLGVSTLAPMGAEFSAAELEAYRAYVGADPLPIRVAHCSLDPQALSAPVGIFVNRTNPIGDMSEEQVARIFARGSRSGDWTRWGQAGLRGAWAEREIHPVGIAEEAAAGLAAFMLKKMGGEPFARGYTGLMQSREVVERVAVDPMAIGFGSANLADPRVKLVRIGHGTNPYDRYLLIYLRRAPGRPLASIAKDYVRMVLSREGQGAVAQAPPHYVPLHEDEVKEELSKLEAPGDGQRAGATATDRGMERLLNGFNRLFKELYPELVPKEPPGGLPSLSLYGIITGVSTIGLMDREAWPLEIRPFQQTYGYEPTAVRIGRTKYVEPGVYVNSRNPLRSLTPEQIARLFTAGQPGGDLTSWEQFGWERREIHLYGPRDDGGMVSGLRHARLDGLSLARNYEPLTGTDRILQAVAEDPYAIALAGRCDARQVPDGVRRVAADMEPAVHLYINRAPGRDLETVARGYVRTALSPEGQAALAAEGYVPLEASEAAAQLARVGIQ